MKFIFATLLLIIIAFIAIAIFIISTKRNSRVGIVISVFLFLIIIYSLMINYIDQWKVTKKDILADLKNVNIELIDDFEIIDNQVSGMPERIQKTIIEISSEDKNRIIKQIETAENYKSYWTTQEIAEEKQEIGFGDYKEIYHFQYPTFYSVQTYKSIENYPTRLIVDLDKNKNVIKYQRIEN